MAIINGVLAKYGRNKLCRLYESDPATPSDSIEIEVDNDLVHCFVGVQMFDAGGARIKSTGGAFSVKVKTFNTQQWEAPKDKNISAVNPSTVSIACNLTAVQVTANDLAGVTTWKVFLSQNRG